MTKQEIKYGTGYVRIVEEDGSEVRVTVERKTDTAGVYKPIPIKDVAKLAEALR